MAGIDGWDDYPEVARSSDCQLGDPLWLAPALADFHRGQGLPAIDHGNALLAPLDGLEGNPRTAGAAIAIGALEQGSGSTIFMDGFGDRSTGAWSAVMPLNTRPCIVKRGLACRDCSGQSLPYSALSEAMSMEKRYFTSDLSMRS